jgi:hypothetical protein
MKIEKRTRAHYILSLFTALLVLSGCLAGNSNTDSMSSEFALDELPPMASSLGNYEDIEIPADMKYINDDSISIRTESFRGGIIHYKGRIEANSLKEFIVASMQKNKWKLAGEVSSQDIILAFTKPHRTCMIKIEPNLSLLDTNLTMYVTVDLAATKTLNAFGEPI